MWGERFKRCVGVERYTKKKKPPIISRNLLVSLAAPSKLHVAREESFPILFNIYKKKSSLSPPFLFVKAHRCLGLGLFGAPPAYYASSFYVCRREKGGFFLSFFCLVFRPFLRLPLSIGVEKGNEETIVDGTK